MNKLLPVFVASFLVFASGCLFPHYTVLSAAQLADRGTHHFQNQSRERVTQACVTALTTLGYQVTVQDPATGVIKTSPAPMSSSATGGVGYVNVVDDGLAWVISVDAVGAEITVHATPRGFRNGTEVHDANMWVAQVMDAKFRDLWSEVDSNVKAAPATAQSGG